MISASSLLLQHQLCTSPLRLHKVGLLLRGDPDGVVRFLPHRGKEWVCTIGVEASAPLCGGGGVEASAPLCGSGAIQVEGKVASKGGGAIAFSFERGI